MKKFLAAVTAFAVAIVLYAAEIDVANAVIVMDGTASPDMGSAVNDLRTHLELVSAKKLSGKGNNYKFIFRDGKEENVGTWTVTDKETIFTGKGRNIRYAVSDFLEKELGIVFYSPFDTAYKAQDPIRLTNASGRFVDKYFEHFYWGTANDHTDYKKVAAWISHFKCDKFADWNTAHAFVGWWNKYGKTHPEIFAMSKNGVRGEVSCGVNTNDPAAALSGKNNLLQICCACPTVEDFLIEQHLSGRLKHKNINISSNDGIGNQCYCPECRKLDVPRPHIPEWEVLTDRLLNLANRIARRSAKFNPPLDVHFLSYCETEEAPLREKVESNILVTFCPTDYRLERLEEQLGGWGNAGARKIRVRPNLPCYLGYSSLPLGFEKHGYLYFKKVLSYPQVVGCNIDNLACVWWDTFGFAAYTMGKTILEPDKDFAYWENQYLKAYGEAAPDMKKYYAYWRENIWEKRILPDYGEILKRARYFNIQRGVLMEAGKYYKESDFDTTDSFLKNALSRKLDPAEKQRVEKIVLANTHAKLVFRAATLKESARTVAIRELLKFRKVHTEFADATPIEIRWGDLTGLKMAEAMLKYDLPVMDTPIFWYFKIDPQDAGIREKWYAFKASDFTKWGEMAATHTYWQGTPKMPNMSDALKEKLKTYDGYGWYAQRLSVPADWKFDKVYLLFGAVDDGCNVYVNGRKLLECHWTKGGDESKPFDVEISGAIDWNNPDKTDVLVRVEDKGGQGGIWKRVFLTRVKNSK